MYVQKRVTDGMAELVQRAPRVAADFGLVFQGEAGEIRGYCVNISQSGLLGVFARELDLWTTGELTVQFGEGVLGIRARVARAVDQYTGLVFVSMNAEQKEAVAAAVESARSAMGLRDQEMTPF